jgi:Flp pilus assembly pilin Flp
LGEDKGGLLRKLLSIWQKKEGVSAVEYGLMIGLIALAISISVNQMGITLSGKFSPVAKAFETQAGTGTGTGTGLGTGAGKRLKAVKN